MIADELKVRDSFVISEKPISFIMERESDTHVVCLRNSGNS